MKRSILLALLIGITGCHDHGTLPEAGHDEAHEGHEHGAEAAHAGEISVPPGIARELIAEHKVDEGVSYFDLQLACEVETAPEATVRVLSLVDGRIRDLQVTTGTRVEAGALLGTVISADLGAIRLRHDVAHRNAALARQRMEQVQEVHANLVSLLAVAEARDGTLLPDTLPGLVVGAWKGRLLSARNRLVTAQLDADRVRSTAADLLELAHGLAGEERRRPKDDLRTGEMGAKLLEADADRRLAWSVYKREKDLADGGLAPRRRMDGAQRDLSVARSRLEGLVQQARLDAATMETRAGEDLATAEASFRSVVEEIALEMQTHELEEAKLEAEATATLEVTHRKLADYGVDPDSIAAACTRGDSEGSSCWEIRAPAAGIVLEQHVAAGQSVQEGSLLYTVADPSHLWVQCDVYDRDLARLAGATLPLAADVHSRTWPGETFPGSLDYVAATTDRATRTTRARITITDPDGRLRPGAFVRATVRIPVDRALLVVPRRSLVRSGDGDTVFVKADCGDWGRRAVQVSEIAGDQAWIREGLAPGEVIASRGAHTLDAEQRWSDVGTACTAHAH
ncbi:MAG: efflux RND transporter periplasmic adaptor subunit [Pseudomonadota bacterium]